MAIVDKINALAGSGSGMTIEEALDNLKRNPGSGSGSGSGASGSDTVIYEMNYFEEDWGEPCFGYRSVRSAFDIANDFKLGKHVLLHCNPLTEGQEHHVDATFYNVEYYLPVSNLSITKHSPDSETLRIFVDVLDPDRDFSPPDIDENDKLVISETHAK